METITESEFLAAAGGILPGPPLIGRKSVTVDAVTEPLEGTTADTGCGPCRPLEGAADYGAGATASPKPIVEVVTNGTDPFLGEFES